jgi:hypothetical protein
MTRALEKAHEAADPDKKTLKIFVAPEFFWRGKGTIIIGHSKDRLFLL